MQILAVFWKDTRKLIACFDIHSVVTEMDALVVPGVSYVMSFDRDIFRTEPDGSVYVKEV